MGMCGEGRRGLGGGDWAGLSSDSACGVRELAARVSRLPRR